MHVAVLVCIILFSIAFILLVTTIIYNIFNDWMVPEVTAVPSIFVVLMGIFMTVGLVVSYKEYERQLYLIDSLDRTHEEFVIGVGRDRSTTYYYYYYHNEKGHYIGRQNVENSVIIETNKDPQVRKVKEKGELSAIYEIYVPYGAIITTFNLN